MAGRSERKLISLEVVRTERLTPHFLRVVAGGPGMADYHDIGHTDRYVKVVLPPAGVTYDEPLDVRGERERRPEAEWPRFRTYTVRGVDTAAGELWIDFLQHGDAGLAGPWAAAARPGDPLHILGPGGAYSPDPTADVHLIAGDEAAYPAIASALDAIPVDAAVQAVLEVGDPADTAYLDGALGGRDNVRWLRRGHDADDLADAVEALELPPGRVQVFVHGELGITRRILRHLRHDRGVPLDDLSVSGYWRKGKDEDGFQAEKAAEYAAERAAEGEAATKAGGGSPS